MTLHRPEPQPLHDLAPINLETTPKRAAQRLVAGDRLIVDDRFTTGRAILNQLWGLLPAPGPEFEARKAHEAQLREVSSRLFAPVEDQRIALRMSPPCGFLSELYNTSRFALPVSDLVDLAQAWKAYDEGIHFPVLGHKLHPFYGTYCPTRMTHLELFGTWLSGYEGSRKRAVDVGTGSGVLALMLARSGLQEVVATDLNANAIESVKRELERVDYEAPVEPVLTDLLVGVDGDIDLIVFNPPWTQGVVERLLDTALIFEEGLFERFFDQAIERLASGGKVVLVFSNVMSLVQADLPHPIEAELGRGRFELVNKLKRKVKPTEAGRRTKERVEVWELAKL